jgi:hypothetical protein
MPPAGFEPTVPASKRPQTHALDHAAAGIAVNVYILIPLLETRNSEWLESSRGMA